MFEIHTYLGTPSVILNSFPPLYPGLTDKHNHGDRRINMKNDTFLRFGPPNPAGGMSVLNLGDSQIPETAVLPSSRSTDSYLFAKAWTPKACDPPSRFLPAK